MPKQLIDFLAIKVTKKQEVESTVGGGKNPEKNPEKDPEKKPAKTEANAN